MAFVATKLPRRWAEARRDWPLLSFYERFEAAVAFFLTVIISVVIVVALYRLVVSVIDTLALRALNPLEHGVFQDVFGGIMTVLIALEFNHTIRYSVRQERGIIQARVVILIALLAIARKVVVADLYTTTPTTLGAFAALALSLGLTYWLISDSDVAPPEPLDRNT
jgi:uncharacterized membrane protein (DUF373 family)